MGPVPVIGIDLGTSYTRVGVFQNGHVTIIDNEYGSRKTASCVAFTNTERLIGDVALNQVATNPKNTIYDTKRLIGRRFEDATVQADMLHWPFMVVNDDGKPKIKVTYKGEEKTFFPEEVSAMILTKMKDIAEAYLGKRVQDTVISVPTYFNNSQRQATKNAGKIAGLNVKRLVNESCAAAMAYHLDKKWEVIPKVMVFDLGGGTLDVSIVTIDDGHIEVLSTAGNTHLGGQEFDNRMVNHFMQEFKQKYKKDLTNNKKALLRLRNACERAKRHLSISSQAYVDIDSFFGGVDFYSSITRACFEDLNADLFRSTIEFVEKCLCDARVHKSQINEIVLVGGSTRIPRLQHLLQDFFSGKELYKSINPDEAIVCGAAVWGAIMNLYSSEEVQNMLALNVTPLSIDIEVGGSIMTTIIKANSTVPIRKTYTMSTCSDNQPSMLIQVFESEGHLTKNLLGKFRMIDIPRVPSKVPKIVVNFDIDANGILHVSAVENSTDKVFRITIIEDKGGLSKPEIERLFIEAKNYLRDDEKLKETLQAKNGLESCCFKIRSSLIDILERCDKTIKWLDSNQLADKKEYEYRQKQLERMYNHTRP